ncbi:hypothetical protein [Streptomyces sp. NRRL B-1347]|uniref:hypothetical protein n=1 Tax=Streptomyces sp. NRRL B-1347 TaxID=1476877 RepID=UPI001F35C786|nr:hypothetical protein [Streptomyces sp. NRRL B-1347]
MSIRTGVPSYATSVRPSLVVAGLAVAASLVAGAPAHAGDGGARAAAPVASPVSAPARTVVTEGQVKEAGPGGTLLYPSVTSCLTLTVQLRSGGAVGAHASLFQVPGELRSDRILDRIKAVAGGRAVASVDVRGAVGAWHPAYFTKAIESYGEGEEVPVPTGQDAAGIAAVVARGLGVPKGLVTVTDVPDGDQTVDVPRS